MFKLTLLIFLFFNIYNTQLAAETLSSTSKKPIYIEEIKGNLAAKILAKATDKLPAEISVFLRYGVLKKVDLLEIADYANSYSQIFCQIKFETKKNKEMLENAKKSEKKQIERKIKNKNNKLVNNNEVDAIRHFLVSGIMAGKYSYGIARAFMVAHEHHARIHPQEMMDLYNNELGLREGGQLFESGKTIRELSDALFKSAVSYLQAGRLSVIKADDKLAKPCRYQEHYPNSKHESVDVDSFFIIKDSLPFSCSTQKKSICDQRKTSKSRAFCLYHRENSISDKCKSELKDLLSID